MAFFVSNNILKSVVAALLFILGFFLPFRMPVPDSLYYFLSIFCIIIVLVASSAYFRRDIYETFLLASIIGVTLGYGYGLLLGIISAFLFGIVVYFEKKELFKTTYFFDRVDDLVISYSAAFLGSYPIYKYLSNIYFLLIFPLLFYAFFEGLNRLRLNISKISNFKGADFYHIKENLLSPALFAGLLAVFLLNKEYILAVIFSLTFPLVFKSLQRFQFPSSAEILLRASEFLESKVFGGESTLISAESFSKALAQTSSQNIHADKLFATYLLSALYWAPMSKTLFRQPEKLNYAELEVLKENSKVIAEVVNEAFKDKELSEAVEQFYENYDGSGIPNGLENGDISVLSRAGRVLEKYLILTSWSENLEPLTDDEAVKVIKEASGKLYDPHFVSELEAIVLPKSLESKEEQTKDIGISDNEEKEDIEENLNQNNVEGKENDEE